MSRFKVLWIDDQKEKCRKEIISVERLISALGYEPDIHVEDDISAQSLSKADGTLNRAICARDVDLFIIDYNLKNNLFGGDVVEEIRRRHDIYTDIIFYSSVASSLIDPVKKSFDADSIMDYFDGVYVAPLGDEFIDKVEYVIQKTIKSWYNVHSIRGVVLSKASKFEQMASDVIERYYKPCLNEIKTALGEKGKNVCTAADRKWNAVYKSDDPIPMILLDPINYNWAVKKKIIETMLENKVIIIENWEEIKSFFEDRNTLAHNPIHLINGNLVITLPKEDKILTEEDVDNIRKTLTSVENAFENLLSKEDEEYIAANNTVEECVSVV